MKEVNSKQELYNEYHMQIKKIADRYYAEKTISFEKATEEVRQVEKWFGENIIRFVTE